MLFGAAESILPGRMDRARRLAAELEEHRVEYEALNAKFGLKAHAMWASHLSSGLDLWVNTCDIEPDDLTVMGGRVFDPENSDSGRWYVEWCRDVRGVGILASGGFAAPPEPLFGWAAEWRRSSRSGQGPGSTDGPGRSGVIGARSWTRRFCLRRSVTRLVEAPVTPEAA